MCVSVCVYVYGVERGGGGGDTAPTAMQIGDPNPSYGQVAHDSAPRGMLTDGLDGPS